MEFGHRRGRSALTRGERLSAMFELSRQSEPIAACQPDRWPHHVIKDSLEYADMPRRSHSITSMQLFAPNCRGFPVRWARLPLFTGLDSHLANCLESSAEPICSVAPRLTSRTESAFSDAPAADSNGLENCRQPRCHRGVGVVAVRRMTRRVAGRPPGIFPGQLDLRQSPFGSGDAAGRRGATRQIMWCTCQLGCTSG